MSPNDSHPESSALQPSFELLLPKLRASSTPNAYLYHMSPSAAVDIVNGLSDLPLSDPLHGIGYLYNSHLRTLQLRTPASPVQFAFESFLTNSIQDAYQDRPECKLYLNTGNDIRGFSGKYRGSLKRGGLVVGPMVNVNDRHQVEVNQIDQSFPTVVMEVCFGDGRHDAEEEAALWLEGSEGMVRAVLVLTLKETMPTCATENTASRTLRRKPIHHSEAIPTTFGPISNTTSTLLGSTIASLIIYRLHPTTLTAYQASHHPIPATVADTNTTPDAFHLWQSDLFANQLPKSVGPCELIRFDLAALRIGIQSALEDTARGREKLLVRRERDERVWGQDPEAWLRKKRVKAG